MTSLDTSDLSIVILAGGSGTRFWPASRRLRPKQLLPLGPSAPHSLLASTVARLEGLASPERIYLATGRHLLEASAAEVPTLPRENLLAEPVAKNTAPAIVWASAVIAARDPNAVVAVLPSDQFATDPAEFRETLARAARVARTGAITTIGIVPTRPETGYGYIEVGNELDESAKKVARFVEKPNRETAEGYVANGTFLWNAGMFVFRASTMLAAFERHLPELAKAARLVVDQGNTDEAIERFFAAAPSVSIDYGIMEKETSLAVVPGDFGWSDLGSWESAWELSPKDEMGNVGSAASVFVEAENNLALDLSGKGGKKVIALVGVSDLCVVETDDAILVLPRERSQDVRAVVDALKARGSIEML